MATDTTLAPLSQAEAEQLCGEVRAANRARGFAGWFTAARWQCWGCMRFTDGSPARRCMGSKPGWRGCTLINRRQINQPARQPES